MLPVSLTLENFMSYEQADLKFDFSSALISGETNGDDRRSNGSGKSSLLNAIEWVIWGESRHKTSDNVVRRGKVMCKAELVFEHNSRKYKILRTRNVKNSKMEVQLEEIRNDGTIINLTHDTNKQTDAEIKRILRSNHDVFINSTYFRQNSFFDFVQGTFATRQAIISSMLNLDKWNEYQKRAKDVFKETSDEIDRKKNEVDRLDQVRSRKETASQNLTTANAQLQKWQTDAASLNEEIAALKIKVAEGRDTAAEYLKYRELQKRVDAQKSSIRQVEMSIANKKDFVSRLEQDIKSNTEGIRAINIDLENILNKLVGIKVQDFSKMEEGIIEGRSLSKLLEQQIDTLLHRDVCVVCGHEWRDKQVKAGVLTEKQSKRAEIEDKLKRAEAKLSLLRQEAQEKQQSELLAEKQKLKRSKMEGVLELAEMKKKSAQDELAAAQVQLQSLTAQLEAAEATLQEVSNIERSIDVLNAERLLVEKEELLKHIENDRSKLLFRAGALTQEITTCDEQIAALIKLEADVKLLARKAAVYGQLSKIFSKDGIQAIIIDNIVEELTQQTNYWLAEFSTEPIRVEFITQKRNTKGDWRETFEIEIHTPTGVSQFEDFSGGEQFRIGFAIRLALSTIQSKRMGGETQLLMLDEVSSSLDQAGLEVFVNIIRRLEKEMKILVISHDDKLKEEFEHIITVKKSINGSILEMR